MPRFVNREFRTVELLNLRTKLRSVLRHSLMLRDRHTVKLLADLSLYTRDWRCECKSKFVKHCHAIFIRNVAQIDGEISIDVGKYHGTDGAVDVRLDFDVGLLHQRHFVKLVVGTLACLKDGNQSLCPLTIVALVPREVISPLGEQNEIVPITGQLEKLR